MSRAAAEGILRAPKGTIQNEPTRKKKTRTNAVTVNLREKKSRGRIKTDETVDSVEQRFEKRRACTLALRHADPEKGSTVSLELAKRLKDSTFCPKLNVVKQFYESIEDDDDNDRHHHHEYQQQQTYKFSVTIASRLVETELSRKFKLTESIEGEIVLAAKLAAWRVSRVAQRLVVEKFDGESVLPFTRSNTENHFSYNEQQRYSHVLFSLSPPPRLGSFPSEREDHKDARWCQAPFFLRLFYSNILFRRDDKIPPIIIHNTKINASRVFNEEERA